MLNQAAMETLYSATYLDDYLDCVENLPDDIQRQLSKMMEIDVNYQSLMRELETNMSYLLDDKNEETEATKDEKGKKKIYSRIQQILIKTQELGDEKLQIGQQVQDLVDNKARQLDLDKKNMDFGKEQDSFDTTREPKPSETAERSIKRARRARHEVFVPSILGPSTLEATSFSETPNETHSSHHNSSRVSFSLHTSTSSAAVGSSSSAVVSSSSGNGTGTSSGKSHASNSSISAGNSSAVDSAREGPSASVAEKVSGNTSTSNHASSSRDRDSGTYVSSTPKKSQKQTQEKKQNKKRKSTKQSDTSPQNIPIDPDEPLYCLCDQVSYGEMIGCDNDLCPIEWFHFSCVSLTTKPKGKWYCPKCRGDRPNIMKPKAIFLKELEKYNREKEEKA